MTVHRVFKVYSATVLSVVSAFLLLGCGIGEKQLAEAETRVNALSQKGVADSLLSGIKVHIYQARTALSVGKGKQARRHADSADALLEKVEQGFSSDMTDLKPEVESLMSTLSDQAASLTGLSRQTADSMMALIDSLYKQEWLSQTRDKAREFSAMMEGLVADQEVAARTRPKVIGTWIMSGTEGKAQLTSRFELKSDNTIHIVEEKKGQSSDYLKEDWKFLSWGTWDLKGDTVMISITREKCPRQVYWNYHKKEKKWKKSDSPTYDSTYTDGRKDRYMAYAYMKENMRKR